MSPNNPTGGLRTDDQTAGSERAAHVTPQLLRRGDVRGHDGTPVEVLADIEASLFEDGDGSLRIDEELVTECLDEILLALIELRDDGTHGTGLMDDMTTLFDVHPSPGTVYPRLHDLDDQGYLCRHDLVQTKQYAIDDEQAVTTRLESAMYAHLALGMFLQHALASG